MKLEVKLYNGVKYLKESEVKIEVQYDNIVDFKVVRGENSQEVKEIEETGLIDKYHEYLILHDTEGNTITFGNSNVDLFGVR